MKAIYIYMMIVSGFAALFMSCSDSWPYTEDAYQNTRIDVYPSYITLSEDEFSGEFTVSSNESWTVYDYPSWIHISNSYGYGYDRVSFTVDENTGSSNRYGYIDIKTANGFTKTESVSITQPPTKKFNAYMQTTNYKAEGDYWSLTIEASATRSWTIRRSDTWVHLGSSSNSSSYYTGKGESNVWIYVDANTSSYSRSSTLTVESGSITKTIKITQNAGSSSYDQALSPSSWTSTNHTNGSTSYKSWSITAKVGDVLSFNYDVSSESGCDVFNAKLSGAMSYTIVDRASGSISYKYASYTFTKAGTYTLRMEYVKDNSVSSGSDQVSVYNLKIKKK